MKPYPRCVRCCEPETKPKKSPAREEGICVRTKKIYEADLPHRAVAVYLYLQDRANAEKTCYPAIGTIARELNLSVSTVKRAISDLEKMDF